MDWLSFTFGFFAFPILGLFALGVYSIVDRLLSRSSSLADLGPSQRGATLSFSSRLIGEIGERINSEAGPTAKAS